MDTHFTDTQLFQLLPIWNVSDIAESLLSHWKHSQFVEIFDLLVILLCCVNYVYCMLSGFE